MPRCPHCHAGASRSVMVGLAHVGCGRGDYGPTVGAGNVRRARPPRPAPTPTSRSSSPVATMGAKLDVADDAFKDSVRRASG